MNLTSGSVPHPDNKCSSHISTATLRESNNLFFLKIKESFPFVPPSLVGAYYLQPQTHVPYFYMMIYYVICTSSVTGGGGTNRKDPNKVCFKLF